MARPKLPAHARKTHYVRVRLTALEHAQAQLVAQQYGIGLAELTRRRLLGVRLPAPPSEEKLNAHAVSALNRIGVNLNQIAKRMNAGHSTNLGKIVDALDRIHLAMDKLNESDRT